MPFRVGASIPLLLSSSRTGAKSEWRSAIVSREESIVAGAVARAQKARSGGVSTAGGGRRCNGLLRGVGRNVFHHARPALLVSQDGQPRERAAEIAARQSQSCSPRDLIRRPRIQADRGRRENSAPYKRRQKDRVVTLLEGVAFEDGEPVQDDRPVLCRNSPFEIDRRQIVQTPLDVSSEINGGSAC